MSSKPGSPFWLLGAAWFALLASCTSSHFEPPQRCGPPALVVHENEPRLWVLVKQEEQKQISKGFGRRSSGSIITETRHHFDLQCHDARTAERMWKKRLLTLKQDEGGHSAQARILGQDGNVVWLFVNDQPVAISSGDGSVLADRAPLEQRNSTLQGLMPKELKFYAFDAGLVITAADSRRYKVRPSDFAAEPYQPASEEHFTRQQFMSTTWNGGYHTGDFLTRMAMLDGRWLGLYTEKEAADAGDDSFGDRLKDPTRVLNQGSGARRSFWSAQIGKTKEFTEGTHDRLSNVTRMPGAPEFLEGGLLVRQGTKEPLKLQDPTGLLVVHRTRLDAEGRLALTRLDEELREKWSSTLPFLELGNRFEFPDRLLMYGAVQLTEKGVTQWQEFIVALELVDGRTHAWNLTLERGVAAAELEKSTRK